MRYAGMQLLQADVTSDLSLAQRVAAVDVQGHCQRCGNAQLVALPNGERYCPACINLGRVTSGDWLYRFAAPPVAPTTMTWSGQLTKAQAQASARLVAAVAAGQDYLLWAVTGAGKTEMLFAAISSVLAQGQRVAVAAPRVDVVRELAPRLQAAFAHTAMAVRYGGAPWPTQDCPLVVCTTHQLLRYYQAFDLLVVDEVDAFPFAHDQALAHAVNAAARGAKVWLSATPPQALRRLGHSVLPRRFHGYPLPVPQVQLAKQPQRLTGKIRTQLNQWVGDYQVLVFVPDISWLAALTKTLTDVLGVAVAGVHANDPQRAEKVAAFRAGTVSVLVATTILERGVTIPHCAVVVLAADSPRFGQAALIQMAGRAGRAASSPDDPVVYVARHYTRSIQLAIREIKLLNAMEG